MRYGHYLGILLVNGALMAWPGAAAAQATSAGKAGTSQGTSAGQGATAKAQPSSRAEKAADAFMKEAAEGGLAEVELGRLAADKASSDAVKKFGQRMVDDHGKANSELQSIAQQKNVTLPTDLNAKDRALKAKLEKASGPAFDREYMKAMVQDHTKDVKTFQREAKTGKDADVKAFAEKTVPTLEEHLKQAKEVDSQVAGTARTKEGTESAKPKGRK